MHLCPDCNREFISLKGLQNHQRWHVKGYRDNYSLKHKGKHTGRITGVNNPNYKKFGSANSFGAQRHSQHTKHLMQEGQQKFWSSPRGEQVKDALRLKTGELSPTWCGGVGRLPYGPEFTPELKGNIKERDNFECRRCGGNLKLCVHHIDYNKFNNARNNLITLCEHCNLTANGDRDFWFAYYTYIMENVICACG